MGQAIGVKDRTTQVAVTQGKYTGSAERIRVEGREELTYAEKARDEFFLRLLQGLASLDECPFVRLLWFPPQAQTPLPRTRHIVPDTAAFSALNDSQQQVAAAMVSTTKEDIVIAHGNFP